MAIAITLQQYLDKSGIVYDVLPHAHTQTSLDTAQTTHVPPEQIAKSVILEDESGYLMAVIPASHHIDLGQLSRQLERRLGLATENELDGLFRDCATGAIPPIGEAYQMEVVMDDSLEKCPDVYFEAGDHMDLIHVDGPAFLQLMQHAWHGYFSRPVHHI
jgi:Ala-tRNA(Pro) deacylase